VSHRTPSFFIYLNKNGVEKFFKKNQKKVAEIIFSYICDVLLMDGQAFLFEKKA